MIIASIDRCSSALGIAGCAIQSHHIHESIGLTFR